MKQASPGFVQWFLRELFGSDVRVPDHVMLRPEPGKKPKPERVGKQEKEEDYSWLTG